MIRTLGIHLYAKAQQARSYLSNQRGAQAIEYIGIAAVAVVLIIALLSMFGDGGIASKLKEKIEGFIDKIKI
ncbi:Flp family type IVb pilin [Paenibacillus pasadenensis]|uniref:Flp pilus assembly protein, pilin Flp n=1 Tax=Paenibacillus pasadenensis TaxID=217090 RepID=A0A2N5N1V4_9BACL|nr:MULTISPECIES: hypothetical protein [Paenibacillus]PLT44321.1 hypothetical protein B8V81_2752 [Paenibacillus pasadenensis]QGG54832.1 hypothetical protein GE073_04015 [Paenibacillus sp. B01]